MHIIFGPWASFFLVFFVMLFALITVGLFGAIAFALIKVQKQMEKLTVMAEPIIAKATNTLDTVQRITVNVGEKADTILVKGEALTDNLTTKVEQTSTVVQKTVTSPLIKLSSILTGLSTGLSVWSQASSQNAKGMKAAVHRNGVSSQATHRETITPSGR